MYVFDVIIEDFHSDDTSWLNEKPKLHIYELWIMKIMNIRTNNHPWNKYDNAELSSDLYWFPFEIEA